MSDTRTCSVVLGRGLAALCASLLSSYLGECSFSDETSSSLPAMLIFGLSAAAILQFGLPSSSLASVSTTRVGFIFSYERGLLFLALLCLYLLGYHFCV